MPKDMTPQNYRNFMSILVSSAILGSAMPMLIVLGGLAGLTLAPSKEIATFPPSIQMLAGLLVAAPVSMFMGRFGRRRGFMFGASCALLGGLLGALAIWMASFWMLCLAHAVLGAALVSFGYFRFAAGEAVPEHWQSVAISFVLGAGLIAAFIGPEIFIQTKDLLPEFPLAGAYLSICIVCIIGFIPLSQISLPRNEANSQVQKKPSLISLFKRRNVLIALFGAAISGGVMMFIMTPTPLAMVDHGFHDHQAGDVIRWHVIAMFLPSFFTGFLIRKFGVYQIIGLGLVVLAGSSIVAMVDITLMHFYGSLILLGVGWNFCFIGSTSLLTSSLDQSERASVQGVNETLVAAISTIASFSSGAIIAYFGWINLAIVSLLIVCIALLMLLLFKEKSPQKV